MRQEMRPVLVMFRPQPCRPVCRGCALTGAGQSFKEIDSVANDLEYPYLLIVSRANVECGVNWQLFEPQHVCGHAPANSRHIQHARVNGPRPANVEIAFVFLRIGMLACPFADVAQFGVRNDAGFTGAKQERKPVRVASGCRLVCLVEAICLAFWSANECSPADVIRKTRPDYGIPCCWVNVRVFVQHAPVEVDSAKPFKCLAGIEPD